MNGMRVRLEKPGAHVHILAYQPAPLHAAEGLLAQPQSKVCPCSCDDDHAAPPAPAPAIPSSSPHITSAHLPASKAALALPTPLLHTAHLHAPQRLLPHQERKGQAHHSHGQLHQLPDGLRAHSA